MLEPIKLANNHFLSSLDMSHEEIIKNLDLAKNFKNKNLDLKLNDILGLIFDNFLHVQE